MDGCRHDVSPLRVLVMCERRLVSEFKVPVQFSTSFYASLPLLISIAPQAGGLQQQNFILSQFWRPESKTKVSAGPSEGSRGGSFITSSQSW